MPTAVVTGASGFVGPHLVQALRDRGFDTIALVRKSSNVERLQSLGVEFAYGDVTQPESLTPVIRRADVVFHAAGLIKALSSLDLLHVNQYGTRHVAEACAKRTTPPVLVVVSSMAAAGPSSVKRPRTEDDPPAPVSNYGRSKRLGELEAERLAGNVPTTIIRPPIVFGEGDQATRWMFRPVKRRGVHFIPSRKEHCVSLIHAADLSEGLLLAAEKGRRLETRRRDAELSLESPPQDSSGYYYMADDQAVTYTELGKMIAAAVGREQVSIWRAPEWLGWTIAGMSDAIAHVRRKAHTVNLDKIREATAGSWTCSSQRAKDELGFDVGAPLERRLRRTAEWYAQAGWL